MALTLDALITAYREAVERIPLLTVSAVAGIGSTWKADPATGAIQIEASLSPNDAASAFLDAVDAIDRAMTAGRRALLRVVPEQRSTGGDDEGGCERVVARG